MAAGLVYHNIVTKTGVDFTIAGWAPDTALPDANILPSSLLIDIAGAEVLGQVTASPAANTIGARLKTIADVEGTTAGAAVITDATGTIQQYLRGLVKRWADALGAGTAAAALRVTSASDDPAVTGIGGVTETAPATDTASSGLNGRLQRIAQRLTSMIALLPTALGAGGGLKVQIYNSAAAAVDPLAPGSAADSASAPVAFSTEGKAQLGSLTETAPATDTASSGLNGRLQRIAQRITSMIALLPAALGASGGLKVQGGGEDYEAVAASQSAQAIGGTGAAGDYLSHVIVSPATAGCGVVTILDNAIEIAAFPGGGTTALSNLIPFVIPIGMKSVSGAWKITTGANVKCVAVGKFTA